MNCEKLTVKIGANDEHLFPLHENHLYFARNHERHRQMNNPTNQRTCLPKIFEFPTAAIVKYLPLGTQQSKTGQKLQVKVCYYLMTLLSYIKITALYNIIQNDHLYQPIQEN